MADGAPRMTPLQFEAQYSTDWQALEDQVRQYLESGKRTPKDKSPIRGDEFAARYRRCCEQLALARERNYPAYLIERLELVTADAHQLIYQHRRFSFAGFTALLLRDFPRCVRQHRWHVLVATLLLVVPMLVTGWLVYREPELILAVVDADTASSYEEMYSSAADSIGRRRDVDDDWTMFGFYIRHNVGLSFQCFAGGLFLGVGSMFFLAMNGTMFGSLAGYLTGRGLGETFYSFVVTHGAFELTAIVLSGAAGLRIGHALLAPGRYSRGTSLVHATREVLPMVYGFALMLLIAAAIEAFWSSATWMPHVAKYSVAGACWLGVLAYLSLQGRRAD
jgi:uncharacterized membrane protein SpoIIM required for sporulation